MINLNEADAASKLTVVPVALFFARKQDLGFHSLTRMAVVKCFDQ